MCAETCMLNFGAPRFLYGIRNTERCNSSGCDCFCEFSKTCRVIGHDSFILFKFGTGNESLFQKRKDGLAKISIVWSFQFCDQIMRL